MFTTILKLSLFLFAFNSFAESKWVKVTLAAFVNTKRVFRGAEFFPHPFVFAGPAFTFFDDFQLRGPSLVWSPHDRKDKHQFQASINYLNDGEPPLTFGSDFDEETDYRAKRSDSIEGTLQYQYSFGFRNSYFLRFFYAKELNRHFGNYGELSFRMPVYKFLSLTSLVGYGDIKHNQYVYGPTAVSGLTHTQADLNYMIRDFTWCDLAFLNLSSSWVSQKENRNGFFVRGRHNQTALSVRTLWFL